MYIIYNCLYATLISACISFIQYLADSPHLFASATLSLLRLRYRSAGRGSLWGHLHPPEPCIQRQQGSHGRTSRTVIYNSHIVNYGANPLAREDSPTLIFDRLSTYNLPLFCQHSSQVLNMFHNFFPHFCRCTSLYGTPTMFVDMINLKDLKQYDLSCLSTGIMAGAPCLKELVQATIDILHMRDVSVCHLVILTLLKQTNVKPNK